MLEDYKQYSMDWKLNKDISCKIYIFNFTNILVIVVYNKTLNLKQIKTVKYKQNYDLRIMETCTFLTI